MNFNTEIIQKNLITSAISAFDPSSATSGNTDYNLYNAFNFQYLGAGKGKKVQFNIQRLTGGKPSILVDRQTNANLLTPVKKLIDLSMVSIGYEVPFDDEEIEAGEIDVNEAVLQAKDIIEAVMWKLMLTGSYEGDYLFGNNLFSQGSITKSPVKFNDTSVSANQILRVIADAKGKVAKATGRMPNTLIIGAEALDTMGLADTNIADFITDEYIAKKLKLKIYPTQYLDNVKYDGNDLGSCFVLLTQSPQDLVGVIGTAPKIGKTIDNGTFGTLTNVKSSFGGFCRINNDPNAIQIVTNIG